MSLPPVPGYPPHIMTTPNGQKRGRRQNINPDRLNVALNILRLGHYEQDAFTAAGIPKSTWYMWKAKAHELDEIRQDPRTPNPTAKHETELLDFLDAVEKAKAEGSTQLVRIIYQAAADSWQAAAWILERSRPEQWGRKDRNRLELQTAGREVRDLEVDADDVDQLEGLVAALSEAGIIG